MSYPLQCVSKSEFIITYIHMIGDRKGMLKDRAGQISFIQPRIEKTVQHNFNTVNIVLQYKAVYQVAVSLQGYNRSPISGH
jgi:tyrosyl-tRNA synthetase